MVGRSTRVCTENLNPDVIVMKSAKDRVALGGYFRRETWLERHPTGSCPIECPPSTEYGKTGGGYTAVHSAEAFAKTRGRSASARARADEAAKLRTVEYRGSVFKVTHAGSH